MACGLAPDKVAEVNAEIVKFIPAKFKSGTALNTYNSLAVYTHWSEKPDDSTERKTLCV